MSYAIRFQVLGLYPPSRAPARELPIEGYGRKPPLRHRWSTVFIALGSLGPSGQLTVARGVLVTDRHLPKRPRVQEGAGYAGTREAQVVGRGASRQEDQGVPVLPRPVSEIELSAHGVDNAFEALVPGSRPASCCLPAAVLDSTFPLQRPLRRPRRHTSDRRSPLPLYLRPPTPVKNLIAPALSVSLQQPVVLSQNVWR